MEFSPVQVANVNVVLDFSSLLSLRKFEKDKINVMAKVEKLNCS